MIKLAVIALGLLGSTAAMAGQAEWDAAMRRLMESGEQMDAKRDAEYDAIRKRYEAMSIEADANRNAREQADAISNGLDSIHRDLQQQNIYLCCPH
jgi:hypothetical protein